MNLKECIADTLFSHILPSGGNAMKEKQSKGKTKVARVMGYLPAMSSTAG
jgi:hypothetical protein